MWRPATANRALIATPGRRTREPRERSFCAAVLAELREDGLGREAFSPAAGQGLISVLAGAGPEDAAAQLARLPFAAHRWLTPE